jgi:pimeloyl-ACP methyl ester carboxylesterase
MTLIDPQIPQRRGCRSLITRGLKLFGLILVILIVVGVGYQTIASAQAISSYPAPGQLIDMGGYRLHINCVGTGSPTVILEAGGISFSSEWYWVQQQIAPTNRVCAYDRAGNGWSDPSPTPRTSQGIVQELHTLLEKAGIGTPVVLAGHSYGGVINRIYAQTYPADVSGIVLVDTAFILPNTFTSDADWLDWKRSNDVLQVAVWAMIRTGVYRLSIADAVRGWGYPPEVAAELTALRSSDQSFDTYYAEGTGERRELTEQSKAAENLGSLPLMILWADHPALSISDEARYVGFQDAVAGYSSTSEVRYVTGSDHGSIIGNQQYAQQVSAAIRDVIAQTGSSANE